jgi:hypothetical protein
VLSARRLSANGRTAIRRRNATVMLRVRQRGRSAAFRAARITGASVAAYLVAQALGLRSPPPLIAALTALLVVQATLSSTLDQRRALDITPPKKVLQIDPAS